MKNDKVNLVQLIPTLGDPKELLIIHCVKLDVEEGHASEKDSKFIFWSLN